MPIKPIANVNQTTTRNLSQPAYDASTMNIAGITAAKKKLNKFQYNFYRDKKVSVNHIFHSPTPVNILRAPVIVIMLRVIKTSLKKPVETEQIHITKYGIDEYKPLSLIEKCKTSLMYFGKSLTMM